MVQETLELDCEMSKITKELKTEIENTEYKGAKTLTIWEVDDEGKRAQYQLLGFGKKKAQAIIKHLDEIKKLAES